MDSYITADRFLAYETVRRTGETNMFDVEMVRVLSDQICDVQLTKRDIAEIMTNYGQLKAKYAKEMAICFKE